MQANRQPSAASASAMLSRICWAMGLSAGSTWAKVSQYATACL
jgi:hypothetical protein